MYQFYIFWGIMLLRGGYVTVLGITGFRLSALVGLLIMWLWTCFALVKFRQLKPLGIILAIWIGISIIEMPTRLISFKSSMLSLPTYLMWCFGIVVGYLSFLLMKKETKRKLFIAALTVVSLFIGVWCALFGYELFVNKMNHDTFTGRLSEQSVRISVEFQDRDDVIVKLADFPEGYLIFDFWSTTCGVCYEKFPQVQTLYDFYTKTGRVGVYSIHCRMDKKGEIISTGSGILEERGYTFPNLSIDIYAPVLKEMGVNGYPTVLIFDSDRSLIFRGSIEFAEKFIAKQLSET